MQYLERAAGRQRLVTELNTQVTQRVGGCCDLEERHSFSRPLLLGGLAVYSEIQIIEAAPKHVFLLLLFLTPHVRDHLLVSLL